MAEDTFPESRQLDPEKAAVNETLVSVPRLSCSASEESRGGAERPEPIGLPALLAGGARVVADGGSTGMRCGVRCGAQAVLVHRGQPPLPASRRRRLPLRPRVPRGWPRGCGDCRAQCRLDDVPIDPGAGVSTSALAAANSICHGVVLSHRGKPCCASRLCAPHTMVLARAHHGFHTDAAALLCFRGCARRSSARSGCSWTPTLQNASAR
jgi:hypothetical protein